MLKRADKERVVAELTGTLRGAPAVVVASFQALPMGASGELRRALRPGGGRLRVVPKRLFRRVVAALGWPPGFAETADSVTVAWIEGPAKRPEEKGADLLAPAKSVHAFVKKAEHAAFLGGVLEGTVLTGADIERVALLPSLDVLRAQFVGVLAAPVRGLLGVCTGVLRGLPAVLHAKSQA